MTIFQVVLHLISLALKVQFPIGLHPITALQVSPQPLYRVPQHKPHEQHLALLQGMNVFVVLVNLTQSSLVAPAEYQPKDICGQKTAKWEILVIDDLHYLQWMRASGAQIEIVLSVTYLPGTRYLVPVRSMS